MILTRKTVRPGDIWWFLLKFTISTSRILKSCWDDFPNAGFESQTCEMYAFFRSSLLVACSSTREISKSNNFNIFGIKEVQRSNLVRQEIFSKHEDEALELATSERSSCVFNLVQLTQTLLEGGVTGRDGRIWLLIKLVISWQQIGETNMCFYHWNYLCLWILD